MVWCCLIIVNISASESYDDYYKWKIETNGFYLGYIIYPGDETSFSVFAKSTVAEINSPIRTEYCYSTQKPVYRLELFRKGSQPLISLGKYTSGWKIPKYPERQTGRLKFFNNIEKQLLIPEVDLLEIFGKLEPGDYIARIQISMAKYKDMGPMQQQELIPAVMPTIDVDIKIIASQTL